MFPWKTKFYQLKNQLKNDLTEHFKITHLNLIVFKYDNYTFHLLFLNEERNLNLKVKKVKKWCSLFNQRVTEKCIKLS
jgi:hypothetical protein